MLARRQCFAWHGWREWWAAVCGNYRQRVFLCDEDWTVYLALVKEGTPLAGVRIAGYCLMTNRVHPIAIPEHPDTLATVLQRVHGGYALWVSARRRCAGHLW